MCLLKDWEPCLGCCANAHTEQDPANCQFGNLCRKGLHDRPGDAAQAPNGRGQLAAFAVADQACTQAGECADQEDVGLPELRRCKSD